MLRQDGVGYRRDERPGGRHGGGDAVDRFLHWQVNPHSVRELHRHGDAVVVDHSLDHHGQPVPGPTLLCLGPEPDLRPLLADVLRRIGRTPHRVSIEAANADLLPAHWQWERRRSWDWMWTAVAPAPQTGEETVAEVTDSDEINALLDVANPDSHGRPDGVLHWLGVRDRNGPLVATGALAPLPTGVAHLRGISTLPQARGRGLGTALSARLTRLALDRGPACTLGVYSDNAPAIRIYTRLGFVHGLTLSSGVLAC